MSNMAIFERLIRPLRNRVYTMITRAIIESVKDGEGIQTIKANLLAGESRDDIERFQNFGFSSNPKANSECVALSIGGNRDHLIIIVADDRQTRIKDLEPGEAAFYNAFNDFLKLTKDSDLEGTINNKLNLTVDKIRLANDTGEVIDILVKALEALSVEPFIVNKGTFSLLKTQLESFKVT